MISMDGGLALPAAATATTTAAVYYRHSCDSTISVDDCCDYPVV